MAAPAQSWTNGATTTAITSAWNGTATLAVTPAGTEVGSVSFNGQAYTGLNVQLPGWPTGQPS